MKIGIQTSEWYNDKDPLSSLEYIKTKGFESLDFNIDDYMSTGKLDREGLQPTFFDKTKEELFDYFLPLKEASEKRGVIIGQMHAPFPVRFPGDDKKEVNDYLTEVLDKCFAVAEFLGCPAVVVHPVYGDTKKEEFEINLELYRSLIPYIKKYKGVKICLENLCRNYGNRYIEGRFSDATEACRAMDILNEEAGGEYFGFCFDVGHALLTNKNIKEFIKEIGHRLTILHIHDNNGLKDLHMIPYSYLITGKEHVCDWTGFTDGLKEINYKGILSFETSNSLLVFPKEVHDELISLIAAIGKYWVKKIEE